MAKNEYVRDGQITDFNDLFELAEEKKPVIWVAGFRVKKILFVRQHFSCNGHLPNCVTLNYTEQKNRTWN